MTGAKPRPKQTAIQRGSNDNRRLMRAILDLPPGPRDVFLLHRMAGMDYGEIGSHLGMDVQNVQSCLADALARLVAATRSETECGLWAHPRWSR